MLGVLGHFLLARPVCELRFLELEIGRRPMGYDFAVLRLQGKGKGTYNEAIGVGKAAGTGEAPSSPHDLPELQNRTKLLLVAWCGDKTESSLHKSGIFDIL